MASKVAMTNPHEDFPAWLASQGMKLKFAEAMERELGISDYEELLACAEDAQVTAELYRFAREKLPFAHYAVLRRIVSGVVMTARGAGKRARRGRGGAAAAQGQFSPQSAIAVVLEAIVATLNSLSQELLESAKRFTFLDPANHGGLLNDEDDDDDDDDGPVDGDEVYLPDDDDEGAVMAGAEWDEENAWADGSPSTDAAAAALGVDSRAISTRTTHDAASQQATGMSWRRIKTEAAWKEEVEAEAGSPMVDDAVAGADDPDAADIAGCSSGSGGGYRFLPRRVKSEAFPGDDEQGASDDGYHWTSAQSGAPAPQQNAHGRGPGTRRGSAFADNSAPSRRRRQQSRPAHRGGKPDKSKTLEELIMAVKDGGGSSQQQQQQQQHSPGQAASGKGVEVVGVWWKPSADKPYHCQDCGKTFTQSAQLNMHRRIHTGERPYKCGFCGKAFTQSAHLAQHRRTHTGERPYKCGECGRAFITSSHLSRHRKVHIAALDVPGVAAPAGEEAL